MENKLLIDCKMLIGQAKQMGVLPAALIMNGATHQKLTAMDLADTSVQNRFQGFFLKWRKKHATLLSFNGVPVLDNSHFPDGIVSLQVVPTEEMVQRQLGALRQHSMMPQGQPNPSSAPEPAQGQQAGNSPAPADPDTVKPTLEDLATSVQTGKPSCSDILMRGFESAEQLRNVCVVRVYKNGNIDLATNLGKFELQGVLQHASVWALQNGD